MDIQLRKKLNQPVAYGFMKRLVITFGGLTVLTTDKARDLLCAFNKLKEQSFYKRTIHCTSKHLNNLIEQDHRHIKQRFSMSAGFQSLCHTSYTLKCIELFMPYINKNEVCNNQTSFFRRTMNSIHYL